MAEITKIDQDEFSEVLMNKIILLLFTLILILSPVAVRALDARVETIDGEVFTIKDFSIPDKLRFSM